MTQAHTPTLGLPYPDGSSPADVPFDLEALAQALDGQAGALFASPGDIKLTAAVNPPAGWLFCDGALVSRTTYAKLYAAVGDAFGAGDGSTTFALPDLRSRVPLGAGLNHPLGQAGGEETHALAVGEMPAHAHGIADVAHNHGDPGHAHGIYDPGHGHTMARVPSAANDYWNGRLLNSPTGSGTLVPFIPNSGSIGTVAGTAASGTGVSVYNATVGLQAAYSGINGTGSVGGGGAHNNMPPFAVVHYVIKT